MSEDRAVVPDVAGLRTLIEEENRYRKNPALGSAWVNAQERLRIGAVNALPSLLDLLDAATKIADRTKEDYDDCATECAALRKRLEVSDEHPYDGISCRDETIRLLDLTVAALRTDGKRYRLLRDKDSFRGYCVVDSNGDELAGPSLDAVLDAAIAKDAP